MTVLDKIKAFFKWYAEATLGPKPEAKGAEKKAAETKVAEAPEKKGAMKVAQSRKMGQKQVAVMTIVNEVESGW